jgi:hypothetical protein
LRSVWNTIYYRHALEKAFTRSKGPPQGARIMQVIELVLVETITCYDGLTVTETELVAE